MEDYKSLIKQDIDKIQMLLGNDNFEVLPTESKSIDNKYRPFITAIKTKPFLLLAGLSGTGKSRIAREIARACWPVDSKEYSAQKPSNFEIIQVKPNWHDSSELIGYESHIDGDKFYAGPLTKFIVKAMQNPTMPHILCLDEMNLAPVEQYFAEYLSAIESRKAKGSDITTDPILDKDFFTKKYKGFNIFDEVGLKRIESTQSKGENSQAEKISETDDIHVFEREDIIEKLQDKGLTIPQNLIIIGTVNMDETTFSFSRKVLDRAMTIEMNEVNLKSGLSNRYEQIGRLKSDDLIGSVVEGVDVYEQNSEVCDKVISYLESVNNVLEGTPFKIAYRTRNEFLIYVINNLPYKREDETEEYVIARALDEITSMKILSRIEGDESRVTIDFLTELKKTIKTELDEISFKTYPVINEEISDEKKEEKYVSLAKIIEMIKKLKSGFTSFWA